LTAQNPESGIISYAYDANSNLLQKISPAANAAPGSSNTQIISYCYDTLNRVTGKAYSAQSCSGGLLPAGTAAVSYAYDKVANAIGKLTSLTDQAGSGSYTYDVRGRMAGESRTIAGKTKNMSYGYNLDGSLASLTYPSTATVTYTPDSAGRMLSAIDNGNPSAGTSGQAINYVTGATYGPDSSLTGFVSGNSGSFAGITNSFSFNNRLQPVNMSAASPSATVFSLNYDFHFGNGNNGNVWGITNNKESPRSQSFDYDRLNRLISAQNAGTDCSQKTLNPNQTKYWGYSYGYDAWGNLLSKTLTKCSGENLSVTALSNNQLAGYGYDPAGNMTSDLTDGVSAVYDPENRISTATKNGVTTSYTYDADGNRVAKSNGTTGTLYWYMSPGIVAESDLSGNLQSEYVFFDGERVARKDFPSLAVSYYFSDHLKTTDIVTDAQGNIKNESDFYPWGGELQFLNNDSNHYKVTAKERDPETGLDYFGARYYSNGLGRFITPDWAATPEPVPYADLTDPQSLNQYSYVRNIPTVKADPDGHCPWCPAIEEGLEELAESPAGQQLSQNLGQATAAVGAGLAAGWAYSKGLLEKMGQYEADAAKNGQTTGGGVYPADHPLPESILRQFHQQENSADKPNVPNPDGSKGAADHQKKVNELVDKAKGEAKEGETVESNKQVKGVDSTRRPDAQIVDANKKTRKVFEAERHPNRKRNKTREAEYKKLKLDNETHPLK
jgi:RHS repeat-associated protein